MKFIGNIKAAFAKNADTQDRDRGDLVQTIIITAGFAVAGFLLVNWISTALLNKGADIAQCIEGSNTYNTAGASANCQSANHASKAGKSFKSDSVYQGRFG